MHEPPPDWRAFSVRGIRSASLRGRHGPRRLASRSASVLLALLVVANLLVACGDTRPARQPEGTVAFRSGSGEERPSEAFVAPGRPFQRLGMLAPAHEQSWQAAWVEEDRQHPLLKGATAGMTTGLGFMMMIPMGAAFWPAAVGVVVGSTAMGILGVTQGESADLRLSAPDRTVIADATKQLQPDRLFRASVEEVLGHRRGEPLPTVTWQQRGDTDPAATDDPLGEARRQGLDGVVECAVDALGLAAGEERDTVGVFLQVRLRALDAHNGHLRYERVVRYGPGQAVEGLPRADVHTVEFLAADKGRVFRQVASAAIRGVARVLAEDPQLPLAQ